MGIENNLEMNNSLENERLKLCEMHASNAALLQSEKMKSDIIKRMGEVSDGEIENVVTEIYLHLKDMYQDVLFNDIEPEEQTVHINFLEVRLVPDVEKIKEMKELINSGI